MSEPTPIPPPAADREARTAALLEALEERILVLDGATGTALQAANLTAADFGGAELEGCNEQLAVTRPDVVRGVSERYLAAGADVVETNSFGSTPLVLAEYGLADRAFDLSRRAAALAREACQRYSAPGRLRFVCGAMGPTTRAISVTGGVTFEELIGHFRTQAAGLMAGGADYLLLETCQDTRNVKAGLIGIEEAYAAAGWRLPVAVSVTLEPTGTMLAGQDAEALAVSLLHADLLYVGVNCATGPELMADHLRTLSALCRTRVACVPNAGLPDEEGRYREGPEVFREVFARFLDQGWLNLVGGCCGTTDWCAAGGRDRCRTISARWSPGSRRWSSPPRTGRCWSASAPTSSARGTSSRPSRPAISRPRRRSGGPRSRPARRFSTSACRIPIATSSAISSVCSNGSSGWSRRR